MSLNIRFTDKALRFINAKRLIHPAVLVNLGYRSGGGGCSGGASSAPIPYTNALVVTDGDPGRGFEKVSTDAGIPVYMAKPIYQVAEQAENPLLLDATGLLTKRLTLEGLDLSPLCQVGQQNQQASCH